MFFFPSGPLVVLTPDPLIPPCFPRIEDHLTGVFSGML
jgi:hypothetical protein